jgi:GntR family transcriptional regulator
VRQAFAELVSESLVYRVRGRGTFASPASRNGAYLRSFGSIDDLLALSIDTELEIIEPLRLTTDASAAGRLHLASDQVFAATIRRLHEGSVFCVTHVSLPVDVGRKLAPQLETIGLASQRARSSVTVIGLLEHVAHVGIAGAHQSVTAATAPPAIAELIECGPTQPVLRIDRVYYEADGRLVELAVTYFNADRYSYRLEIRRSS